MRGSGDRVFIDTPARSKEPRNEVAVLAWSRHDQGIHVNPGEPGHVRIQRADDIFVTEYGKVIARLPHFVGWNS